MIVMKSSGCIINYQFRQNTQLYDTCPLLYLMSWRLWSYLSVCSLSANTDWRSDFSSNLLSVETVQKQLAEEESSPPGGSAKHTWKLCALDLCSLPGVNTIHNTKRRNSSDAHRSDASFWKEHSGFWNLVIYHIQYIFYIIKLNCFACDVMTLYGRSPGPMRSIYSILVTIPGHDNYMWWDQTAMDFVSTSYWR